MYCVRCKSPRVMKFVDGFGSHRIFCRTCSISYPNRSMPNDQTKLPEFHENFYSNFAAVGRGLK